MNRCLIYRIESKFQVGITNKQSSINLNSQSAKMHYWKVAEGNSVQTGWSDPGQTLTQPTTSRRFFYQEIGISRVHLHPLLIQSICSVKFLHSATNKGVQLLVHVIQFCPNPDLSSPAGHSRPGRRGHTFPHTWKEGFVVKNQQNAFVCCWFKWFTWGTSPLLRWTDQGPCWQSQCRRLCLQPYIELRVTNFLPICLDMMKQGFFTCSQCRASERKPLGSWAGGWLLCWNPQWLRWSGQWAGAPVTHRNVTIVKKTHCSNKMIKRHMWAVFQESNSRANQTKTS